MLRISQLGIDRILSLLYSIAKTTHSHCKRTITTNNLYIQKIFKSLALPQCLFETINKTLSIFVISEEH